MSPKIRKMTKIRYTGPLSSVEIPKWDDDGSDTDCSAILERDGKARNIPAETAADLLKNRPKEFAPDNQATTSRATKPRTSAGSRVSGGTT